jgi:hypothetical protein
VSEQGTEKDLDKDKPPRPTRGQRLAAFGFLGAFGLTILTVILTGLRVGAPAARHVLQPGPPAADTGLQSPRPQAPAGSVSAAPQGPAAAPSVSERQAQDDAAREDAATRERDEGTRERHDATRGAEDAAPEAGDRTRNDSLRDANDPGATDSRARPAR